MTWLCDQLELRLDMASDDVEPGIQYEVPTPYTNTPESVLHASASQLTWTGMVHPGYGFNKASKHLPLSLQCPFSG